MGLLLLGAAAAEAQTDTTPPTLQSAIVLAADAGATIELTFDEPYAISVAASTDVTTFSVTADGNTVTVGALGYELDTGDNLYRRVRLRNLSPAITHGQTVIVSYTDPTVGDDTSAVIEDAAGNDVASFTTGSGGVPAVINNAPAPPTIDAIALTSAPGSDNTYAIGDAVTATVTFDAAVDIAGTPQLELDFAGTAKAAACTAAMNTTTMACSYTVAVGDAAPNGVAIAANKLTGGTITVTGSTTLTADLAHVAVAIDAGHKVDGIRPTLVTTGSEAPTTSTDGTQVILTFSEDLSAFNINVFFLNVGGVGGQTQAATASFSGRTVTITLHSTLTIAAGATVTVGVALNGVEDAAGNGNLALAATTVINAVGVPTVSGVALTSAPGSDNTYAIGDAVTATVTFDAAVDITGSPQLELDFAGSAKAAACATGTNTTTMACSYTVVVGDVAAGGVAIGANTLTGGTIYATGSTTANADLDHVAVPIDAGHKVDGIRPTLVTTGSEAPTTSTDGTQVILTFSEDIGSVDRADIAIFHTESVLVPTSNDSISGRTVELTLTTALTDSTWILGVDLAVEAVTDAVGNANAVLIATAVINAIGSTPAPTVTAVALTSAPDDATYGYKIGDEIEATVTFSAAVDITGTPQLELDFAGTPKPAACTADTGTEATLCSYTVVMGDSAPNGIAIAANTLTLNGGTIRATASTTLNADLTHSVVAIDTGHKVDGIRPTLVTTGSEAPTTSTDGTTVILTFSEDIRGVNRSLITIQANGVTLSTTAASRAGTKAELTLATALTATATNLTVSLATNSVSDPAGNGILFVAATAVTNAVGAPDPPGTLKARRGDGEVHLEWVPVAAVPTDPDRAYQLRYGAEGGESNQWRDIPRSAPGGPNARSYTVTRLENGTRYAFELRVRRASGFGTAAKIRQTPEAARWSVSTNRRSVHEGEDVTLSIATRNAVGFYSAPEVLTLAVIAQIVLEFATIDGADPEDFEIRVDGTKVQGYTKDITLLNFDKDLDRDPFPAQHFDVAVPVGSTSLDVTVTVLADEEEDGQEHMSFMVFRGEELVNEDTWEETGVNIESRDAGVVKQLAVADAEATEGEDPSLDFVVTLAPAAAWTVTVDYATHDGGAEAGTDYTATSGTLTFAAGETAKTVSVPVIDDTVEDTPETLTVRLSNANPPYNEEEGAWEWGSEEAGVLIADAVATGTIRNTEDPAEPRAVDLSADFPESAFTSTRHTGSDDRSQVVVAFSEAVAEFAANTPSVSVTGASGVSVQTHTEDGLENAYVFFMTPDGDGDVTFALTTNAACAAGGICTADGTVLTQVPAAWTIPGPEAAADDDADDDTAPASLTAAFGEVPPEHDGQSAFNVRVEFSEDVGISYKALRDESFSVTDGDVTGARRVDGRHDLWEITVEPDSREAVTISLPGGSACGTAGAVCTRGDDPRPLSNSPSATVADAEATEEEDAALDFVVTLDPAATAAVTVDYATADGTATAGSDYTATSGTLTFQPGETSKTVSVPITDDAVEDGGEILTLTLSGASGADLDDAEATGTIQNTETSLTASFEDVPSEHDGSTVFTFRLRFSEDPAVSYKVLRDRAFSVSGGTVKEARRVDGRNDLREIHVQPETTGEIRIDLPATTDCDAVDAICTEDGRPLSHSLSETIASPVGISVADARVDENGGAPLAFAVTLSRAAAGQVTVDYQTVNGTASAGTDYTAANGTLTFEAGESSQAVEVAVLDDSHDEGEETMTLRLSNPSEGRLADAEATGTIENTDPLPRALLARFGRATALQVMEQVEERLEASRASGFRGRFAGRELRRGMERDMGRNFLTRLQSTAVQGARDTTGVQSDLSGSEFLRTGLPGGGDLLMGSGFVLNRETGGGASVSLWSRGMESRFSGRDGELSLDGGVRTTMFGADYAKGPLMAGLMLSHRRGLGGYQGADVGEVASSVTGLHPWVGYKLSERVTLWGVTGYGRGSMSLTPGEALSLPTSLTSPASPMSLRGGLSMAMLAGGVRGDLVDSGAGGFGLAFKADALWVGTGSEAVDGPAGRLAGTEAVVTRVRTALEASRGYVFGHGIALRPSLEVGLRQDGGDAETGAGADIAGSLIAADPLTGLSVDVRVRTLLVHQAQGFRERSVSVSFSYDPTPSTPLGFTARVAPSWGGQAMSGADALWGRDTMEGLGAAGPGSGDRLDAELGYALPVGSRLVGTPRFGVTTSEYGRDYRLGYKLTLLQRGTMNFEFGLDAQRRESLLQEKPDHSLMGRVTATW